MPQIRPINAKRQRQDKTVSWEAENKKHTGVHSIFRWFGNRRQTWDSSSRSFPENPAGSRECSSSSLWFLLLFISSCRQNEPVETTLDAVFEGVSVSVFLQSAEVRDTHHSIYATFA